MTTPQRWQEIDRIFAAALEQEPAERAAFLDQFCGGDEELRKEVESLLAHDSPESLIGRQAIEEPTQLLGPTPNRKLQNQNIGPYQVIRSLGAGAMGHVYLAHDKRLKRSVAVKLLSFYDVTEEERIRRFRREALAASALNHPNILTIYEIGEAEGHHFIATEFVDGQTLQALIGDGNVSMVTAVDIVIQIAKALSAAHAAGIVHRDIKPANIMVRADGLVKVLDFGVAKYSQPDDEDQEKDALLLTNPGAVIGTAAYMSPEQARGNPIDPRTDIWSLCVILYELVTGRRPFEGPTAMDVISAVLERRPLTFSEQGLVVPAPLERIIFKALKKDRDARYSSANEVLADLNDLTKKLEAAAEDTRHSPEGQKQTRVLKKEATGSIAVVDETTPLNSAGQIKPETPPPVSTSPADPQGKQSTTHQETRHVKPKTTRLLLGAGVIGLLLLFLVGPLVYVWRGRQTPVAPGAEITSLAVLPLKSLDAGENYLGLGIADAVIRRINQTGKVIVRPTSAVRRYLNDDTDALTAARQLNADAVLEGSVQRSGDLLRVSVNLLRTSDGFSLWTDNFDLRMTDIFTIQDSVAQQVSARLRLQLDPSQRARLMKRNTSNPIAYEFYLKGVYSFDQRGWGTKAKPQAEETIDLFKKAIELDPNFALAHAQLANVYAWMANFIEPDEQVWVERAKGEVNQAQALDPQLAETHVARHFILRTASEGWQIEAAIRELLLAQQLDPNTGHAELGILYLHIGLEDLCEREMERALNIDPTSESVKAGIINSYVNLNKYDEGLAAQQKWPSTVSFRAVEPNGKPDAWYLLGKGRLEEAQTQIEETLAKTPEDRNVHRQKAILLALRGDFQTAEAEIPSLLSKRSPKDFAYHHLAYDIACVYALAGKNNEAVRWLRETAATGFPCYPLFERDPYLNRIRKAPDFVQFMAEMKAQFEKYKGEFS
jgi:serine/threonine protein kinase/TolB-like protein/Flp pilus assembly protein TadD